MYVGPFFYLNSPRFSHKGLYADLLPKDKAACHEHKLVSPVSHQMLLDRLVPDADCQEIPRGSVVFDLESKLAIIYIDRCLEKHLDEIIADFQLPDWVIEYDDQFTCPRCDHLVNRF